MKPIPAGSCSYPRLFYATFLSFVFRLRITSQPAPVALTLSDKKVEPLSPSRSTAASDQPFLNKGLFLLRQAVLVHLARHTAQTGGKFDEVGPGSHRISIDISRLVRAHRTDTYKQYRLRPPCLLVLSICLLFFSQLPAQHSFTSVPTLNCCQISKSTWYRYTALRLIHWTNHLSLAYARLVLWPSFWTST